MFSVKNEEISAVIEENQSLKKQIEEKAAEAMELSKHYHNLQWNTKKIDFVSFYEEKERENDEAILQELTDQIAEAEKSWSGLEKRLQDKKKSCSKLQIETETNAKELQRLREVDSKNTSKLYELNRAVNVLKNRNAAMKLKFRKQIQEYEEQIENLSSQQ